VNFDAMLGGCPFPIWDDWTQIAYTPGQFAEFTEEAYDLQVHQPWFWPVCHYSSWIYRGNRYVVVIRKKPRRVPVRWVRLGKQVAFVPPHPHDAPGKAPINLKHGFFVPLQQGADVRIEPARFDPKVSALPMSTPPKEFRSVHPTAQPSVAAPAIYARMIENPAASVKASDTGAHTARITYDYGKGKFVQSGAEVNGHVSKPVVVASLSSKGGYSPGGSSRFAARSAGGSGYSAGHSYGGSREQSGGGESHAGGSGRSPGAGGGGAAGGHSAK
jgi:hypothetical protein